MLLLPPAAAENGLGGHWSRNRPHRVDVAVCGTGAADLGADAEGDDGIKTSGLGHGRIMLVHGKPPFNCDVQPDGLGDSQLAASSSISIVA